MAVEHVHSRVRSGKMKSILILNLGWLLPRFLFWVALDHVFVKYKFNPILTSRPMKSTYCTEK